MTYEIFDNKGKAGRKRSLPLRKWLFPLLLLGVAGGPATAAADIQQPTGIQGHAAVLEQRLTTEARGRLAARARQLQWGDYQAEIQVWLPGSAERLGPCQRGLEVAPARSDSPPWGRLAYTVSCEQPGWRLRARVEARVWMKVWTARHEIARNRKLEADDLVLVRTDISSLHSGFTTDRRQLIGHRTERSIRAGQPVSPGLLTAEVLVHRHDNVVIRAHAQGLTATMTGTALEDGARHEEVKVRNHSSDRTISAWVVERGVVETRF